MFLVVLQRADPSRLLLCCSPLKRGGGEVVVAEVVLLEPRRPRAHWDREGGGACPSIGARVRVVELLRAPSGFLRIQKGSCEFA